MSDLGRFLLAQDGTYAAALGELRDGAKRSHWMWFVFPQIAGLGHSPTARHFAIRDLEEARAYLTHEVLGARLHEATSATAEWAGKRSLLEIFGPVDSLKFVSQLFFRQPAYCQTCCWLMRLLNRYCFIVKAKGI